MLTYHRHRNGLRETVLDLNIFRIELNQAQALKAKLAEMKLQSTHALKQQGWSGDFLFCADPPPRPIPWVKTFADFLGGQTYYNRTYFAVILLEKGDSRYAITFGKAHFFVRPFCDYDFGIEVAKRIADEDDIVQTAARRYQGKQKKDIRSYTGQARLNIPPGDSVDYLQGKIIASKRASFGDSGKFGTSCLLAPDITASDIGSFLDELDGALTDGERFKLPRTLVLSEPQEVERYDEKLIDELMAPVGISEIATHTFDLFGVDFVFSSSGAFTVRCGHYKPLDLERLTMKEIKEYIADRQIPRDKVLNLKITHRREDGPDFTQPIKEAIDFISDDDRVVLRGGKWLKFNEDYLSALDSAIRRIEVEPTEEPFLETTLTEGEFNTSLAQHGYSVADKDFDIFKTGAKAPTEAWDLQRGDTVYAVKFGTPQKLNYVVDQASSVIELIHNRANLFPLPPFSRYCLWFGYRATSLPDSLADTGSIILKQKVEAWARQCTEVGFTPVLKLSRKAHPHHDTAE